MIYIQDATYILVIIAAIITLFASARMNLAFGKYAKIKNENGITGAEAARTILDNSGLSFVRVEPVSGNLSDHYNSDTKIVYLSESTYSENSIAAVGVAAHECGHALQDQEEYQPLIMRNKFVPFANFGSKFGVPIVIGGILFGYCEPIMQIGILIFSLAVLFQLITLPVEFNASTSAIALLNENEILKIEEEEGCKKVLKAAAMTYVAAAAASILSLLRLILLSKRRD